MLTAALLTPGPRPESVGIHLSRCKEDVKGEEASKARALQLCMISACLVRVHHPQQSRCSGYHSDFVSCPAC